MIKNELVDPKKTAILAIDIQNDFCSENGQMAKVLKFDMTPIAITVPKILKFLDAARQRKMTIIWTRSVEDPSMIAPNNAYKIHTSSNPKGLCTPGTYGFEYFMIKPSKGEHEIIKKSYDPFTSTRLNSILKKKKIKNIIFTGFYTSVCVESAVRTAFSLGYHIIVPKDLVSMPKERLDLHRASIKNMGIVFAHITTSKDIIRMWKND